MNHLIVKIAVLRSFDKKDIVTAVFVGSVSLVDSYVQ